MSALSSKSHDPSMEEILASIRRIIADDQEGMRVATDERFSAPSPLKSVLDLTERHVAPLTARDDSFEDIDDFDPGLRGEDEDVIDGAGAVARPADRQAPVAPEPAPERLGHGTASPAPAERPDPVGTGAVASQFRSGRVAERATLQDNRLSGRTDSSVSGSFARLGSALASAPQRSMEDVVTELLRPLLKDWLDDNLPPLVERLVQAEIERISRGRR